MSEFVFPLRSRPAADYHVAPRSFGSRRDGGKRKHAGCDLYSSVGTEVLAMADGTVVRGPYYFYSNTFALEVRHDNGKVVRYGEILQRVPAGVREGARVRQGQVIAGVGRLGLTSVPPMLHLEMYAGTKSGRLSAAGNAYMRRADVIDPSPYLDTAPLFGQVESAPAPTTAPTPIPIQAPAEAPTRTGTGARSGLANNKVSGTLNVRAEPARDAQRVFGLSQGERFEILEEVTGGDYPQGNRRSWYRIDSRGRTGYVAAYFVDADPLPPPEDPAEPPEPRHGVVGDKVRGALNVRAEPDASAQIRGQLQPGDDLEVLDVVQGGDYGFGRKDWVKLRTDSVEGFAAGFFVEIEPGPEGAAFALGEGSDEPDDDPLIAALMAIPTVGASAVTAGPAGLPAGVQASERLAELDLERVVPMADTFVGAASRTGVPAVLLAAMASRESGCGATLQDGWDGARSAFGILQLDRGLYEIEGLPDPRSLKHVSQAAAVLGGHLAELAERHPDWDQARLLCGALVAYDAGLAAVPDGGDWDAATTGGDYCADTLARARFYLREERLCMLRD